MGNRLSIALKALIAETDLDQRLRATERSIIDITQRLDAQDKRPRPAPERKTGKWSTLKVAEEIGHCKESVSMLVNGGHITPANPDAPTGAPHFFDPAHIRNFLGRYSSGEISRMISEYRHRPR